MADTITGLQKPLENFLSLISTSDDDEIENERIEEDARKKRENIRQCIVYAKIPKRHRAFVESQNTLPGWLAGLEKADAVRRNGGIVTLLGGRGTGKTQMAICLIKRAAKECVTCRYTKAIEVSMRIRASYSTDGDTEQQAVSDYLKPALLVIDALEERSGNEWEDRIFNHILDKRYDNVTATILISNESAEQFKKSMGSSVISRIIETGDKVVCNWESFRNIKRRAK